MDRSMNFVASLLAVVVGVLSGFFKKPTLSSTLTRSKFATYREVRSSEAIASNASHT